MQVKLQDLCWNRKSSGNREEKERGRKNLAVVGHRHYHCQRKKPYLEWEMLKTCLTSSSSKVQQNWEQFGHQHESW